MADGANSVLYLCATTPVAVVVPAGVSCAPADDDAIACNLADGPTVLACPEWAQLALSTTDYPRLDDGAELYAWGFIAIIAPSLILMGALVVARGIRLFSRPK